MANLDIYLFLLIILEESIMQLTVISVCLNCENMVEKTIQSLLSQTYQEYEYIVIDGKSTDNTLKIVQSYESQFSNIKIISEPDKGIYDAMNKGAFMAKGKYVYYLNMGDCLCDKYVLGNVVSEFKDEKQIYYGDVLFGGGVTSNHPPKLSHWFFMREKMICHQAIFAKKELLQDQPFDLNFPCCADRDWLIKQFKARVTYKKINVKVANYDETGVSSNYKIFEKDSLAVAEKHYTVWINIFIKGKRNIGKLFRKKI